MEASQSAKQELLFAEIENLVAAARESKFTSARI